MMLRGVFLTSEQPADTARFYREVAGLPMEQVGESGGYVYWRLDDGGPPAVCFSTTGHVTGFSGEPRCSECGRPFELGK